MEMRALQKINIILVSGMIALVLYSCSKKDQTPAPAAAEIISFSLFSGNEKVEISIKPNRSVYVRVPDTILSGAGLPASFMLSPGASVSVDGQVQQSGITKNDFGQDLVYTVTGADRITKNSYQVEAANNDYSFPWGLGHFITHTASENRSYNWYIDQSTSGGFASVNCGPASVTMAIKWADSSFAKTALDARMAYESSGGWWSTNDIDNYLDDNHITHAIVGLSEKADSTGIVLTRQLDHHQVIILCLDMNPVRNAPTDPAMRVDKFYTTTPGWGHFIVLKGYKIVDGELFFEAYDPYSFGQLNSDQTLKGMNRYYRSEDLAEACRIWWKFAFVIAQKGENINVDAANRKLNPLHVPVAHSGLQ
jgi:hypothetical protein